MENYKSIKINATLNTIKQLCMIIFPMITFPFASRVLGTFYYGKINFSSSIISYIMLIAGLGITNYAIREGAKLRKNKSKLQIFCNEIFSLNIYSTLIAYIVLIILIFTWNRLDGYSTLLLIQSLSVFFTTIGTDWINSIFEDYLFITLRYIVCQIISIVLMFTLVKSEEDYLIYAFVSISSIILANIMNIFYIKKRYSLSIKFKFLFNVRQHIQPIMMMFGTALATSIYINSDTTILGILSNEISVGLYGVSSKIYLLVKQLLNAMLIVALPRISNDVSKKKWNIIDKQLEDIIGNLIVITGPAVIGLFMLSENIVMFFSGIEFLKSAESLRILSFSIVPATIACFYVNVVLIPFGKEKIVLISTIISAIVNISLNFVLIPFFGESGAALTTFIAETIMMIFGMFYSRKLVHIRVTKSIVIGCINGFNTLLICYFIQLLNLGLFFTIMLSCSISVFVCILILILFDKEKLKYFISLTNKLIKK